jgi:hypothetical protein
MILNICGTHGHPGVKTCLKKHPPFMANACAIAVCFVLGALFALIAGCSNEGQLQGRSTSEVGLIVAALAVDTSEAVFVLGRDASFMPLGGKGEVAAGPPREAQMTFREVAEGDWLVEFLGHANLAFSSPNPSSFPSAALCLRDLGSTEFAVVSGRRSITHITAVPVSGGCQHVAVDRVTVNTGYQAVPDQKWYGSPDGSNIVTLFVDNWGADSAIEVDANTGAGSSPFGLFSSIPDTALGENWPDAASWNTGTHTFTTDVNGDGFCKVVVKPGMGPTVREIAVRKGTETERVRIWVANQQPSAACVPADCDDGNPCTNDQCVSGSCQHNPFADGTPCKGDGICRAGACTAGVRFEAVNLTTGWASTEGTFNRNHAELRCGDDGRGYQVFPGLTFDFSALPAGTPIYSAVMHLYQVRIDGDSPYSATMNEVVAEHVRYTNMWEADEVPAIDGTIGQRLVSSTSDLGWKMATVTEAVTYELNDGKSQVQVRLRFVPNMTDGDTSIDWAVFASDNVPAPNEYLRPYLILYTP